MRPVWPGEAVGSSISLMPSVRSVPSVVIFSGLRPGLRLAWAPSENLPAAAPLEAGVSAWHGVHRSDFASAMKIAAEDPGLNLLRNFVLLADRILGVGASRGSSPAGHGVGRSDSIPAAGRQPRGIGPASPRRVGYACCVRVELRVAGGGPPCRPRPNCPDSLPPESPPGRCGGPGRWSRSREGRPIDDSALPLAGIADRGMVRPGEDREDAPWRSRFGA
jgi:hypothetical protein